MSTRPRTNAPEVVAIVCGKAVLLGATALARRSVLHPREHAVFRRINGLPATMLVPVFVVMQAGSLAAVFVAAAAAWRFSGRRMAASVFTSGFAAWIGAKGVKRFVQRGRPSAHFADVVVRGPAERGLGYPSGHAAVSFAMATAVAGDLPSPWSELAWATAPIVGFGRVYVGAHLPLDIVGGAALGVVLGSAVRLVRN